MISDHVHAHRPWKERLDGKISPGRETRKGTAQWREDRATLAEHRFAEQSSDPAGIHRLDRPPEGGRRPFAHDNVAAADAAHFPGDTGRDLIIRDLVED